MPKDTNSYRKGTRYWKDTERYQEVPKVTGQVPKGTKSCRTYHNVPIVAGKVSYSTEKVSKGPKIYH